VVQTTGLSCKHQIKPRQGRRKAVPYVINAPEPPLSHCFRNEKSRANHPTGMARRLARVSWWIIRTANGIAESVGGVSDHVHLLIGLRATHRLADVLRELKSVSSGLVHDEIGVGDFAWQEGYGAFTVSPSQRETVRHYIEQQAQHHRTRTFREEYLELLRRSGVEFDERYL
jgi:REP-associated tyrosine transposase